MIASANKAISITNTNMPSKTEAPKPTTVASNEPPKTTVNPTPPGMTTPSSHAKSQWNDVVDHLPSDELQAVTRTYTNRLHQLRLQREKHHSTHERHTKPGVSLPASCLIKFELGASSAIRDKPAYLELKNNVEETIENTQKVLKNAIVQLQVLEMQSKEEEIRTMFCEGLAKIAVSLINYHRDANGETTFRVAKTMQSMRLADRLVELLLEQHQHILEYSCLETSNRLPQYYGHIGRDIPTHSRQQNANAKSSPYNPHHTQLLQGILEDYKNIVEPCFHTSWKEYLVARSKLHKSQQEKWNNSTKNNKGKDGPYNGKGNNDYHKKGEPQLPSAQALKEMVHMAVSEETQGLKDTIKHLEEQLHHQGEEGKKGKGKPAANHNHGKKKGTNNNIATKSGHKKDKAEGTANAAAGTKTQKKNGATNNSNNKDAVESEKKQNAAAKEDGSHKKENAAKEETKEATTKEEGGNANGANDTGTAGGKKKRNRKRNKKGKTNADASASATTNENTNGTAVATTDGAEKTPDATNGAKPEADNKNGAKPEESNKGNANCKKVVEAKDEPAAAEAKESNGNKTEESGENEKKHHPQQRRDSTTELFDSLHSSGHKKWS